MSRWKTINVRAGYVVLGLPPALAVPALRATMMRFGFWDTVVSAVPVALLACTPALLWMRYTRRRPRTRRAGAAWVVVGVLMLAMILVSPIWFWSGPVLLVLSSEGGRVAAASAFNRLRAATLGAPGSGPARPAGGKARSMGRRL